MSWIKLTDEQGDPIYFNTAEIGVVRPVVQGEADSAQAAVMYEGAWYVKETVDEVMKKVLGAAQ
jgi:hypothetical protein